MLSQQQIDEIIEKNDIGDVIGDYVKLERKGSGYMGRCPFHNEKTPSFSVHEGKQIFKCFGCGKGGNVVNFIMYAENLSYPEALEFLAERAGIKIEKSISKAQEERNRLRNDIFSVNRAAARFFYETLKNSPNAQKYLYNRGIRAETVKRFGLGYAADNWDSLYKHFKQDGVAVSDELLEKAGLITRRKEKNGYYDKFRNRVIFPIFDVSGNVIAFGGRVMDDSLPKYLNSPETPVYSKGNNLYALNIAKKSQSDRVIIVEGYMDCIALHKSGISWAVASLGTALTQSQAKLLKKYFSEVIIGYDADGAGQKATARGLDILANAGFRVRVLALSAVDPNVKDPDEFLQKHSKDEFLQAVNASMSLVEYKIMKIAEKYPVTSLESKAMFLKYAVRVLSEIKGETEKDMYLQWFSQKYRVSAASLNTEIERVKSGAELNEGAFEIRKIVKTIKNNESGDNTSEKKILTAEESKLDKLEKTLILLMSDDIKSIKKYFDRVLPMLKFSNNKILLEKLRKRFESGSKLGPEAVLTDASETAEYDIKVLTDLIDKWLRPPDTDAACRRIIRDCGILHCDQKIACINDMLKNTGINEEDKAALLVETAALIEERKRYKNEQ